LGSIGVWAALAEWVDDDGLCASVYTRGYGCGRRRRRRRRRRGRGRMEMQTFTYVLQVSTDSM